MSNITKFNNPYCRFQQDNYLVWHVWQSFIPIKYYLQFVKVQYDNFWLFKFFIEVNFRVGDTFIQFCINLPLYYANLWCMYNSIMWAIVIVQWNFSVTFTHTFIAILAAQLLPHHSLSLNWIDLFQK